MLNKTKEFYLKHGRKINFIGGGIVCTAVYIMGTRILDKSRMVESIERTNRNTRVYTNIEKAVEAFLNLEDKNKNVILTTGLDGCYNVINKDL